MGGNQDMENAGSKAAMNKTEIKEPEFIRKEVWPDICVCCGKPVPEGRMICWNCEHESDKDEWSHSL